MSFISKKTIIKKNMNRLLMTKAEYDNWVIDTARSARVFLSGENYTYGANCGITYVTNLITCRTATARCRKEDEFDISIGLSLAFARYMNRPTPLVYEIVRLADLRIGDTVVRPSGDVVKFCGLTYYDDNKDDDVVVAQFSNTLKDNTIHPLTLTGSPDDGIYRIIN